MTDSQTTPETTSTKKSRRLYLWMYGLTSVMVIVAIAPLWVRYQRQNSVIERLFELSASIQVEPMGPQWLREAAYHNHMMGFYTVTLILSESKLFNDESMNDIQGLTELKTLWIKRAEITDSGLVHLKHLTNLRHLNLKGTQVTESGVKDLQAALPNCEIAWSGP